MIFCFNSFSQCLPVASYSFNGNPNDMSGNGNNGILGGEINNPTLTADRFGNANSAYQFGGYYNKNWIKVPNSATLQFSNQMSVSLWFKQCSFGGMDGYGNYSNNGYFILLSKAGDGIAANPGIWMFSYTDIQNVLHLSYSNKNGYNNSSINFSEDTTFNCFDNCEWVHCVVVINNNLWKMYINGQLIKQKIINSADFTNANTQDLYIGRMFGSSTIWYPFNGVMDDINIYNCALSQNTIDSLYGNYNDPLAINNVITIDSVKANTPICGNSNSGSISIFANNNNAPYSFSNDFGVTYQPTGVFTNLSSGNYTIRIKSSCTFRDTTLTIGKATVNTNLNASICEGTSFFVGGALQTQSGVYIDTIHSNLNCDTIKITTLIVKPKSFSTISQSICQGQSFLGHTTAGTHIDTLVAANGCDSIRTLNLTIKPKSYSTISQTICQGQSYLGYTTTGTYIDTLIANNGCDSIRTLNLTIKPKSYSSISKTICKGQSYLGYTATGTYIDTLIAANGCDSIRTLSLTILEFPKPILGPQNEFCKGDSLILSPGNFSSYLWQDNSTLNHFVVRNTGLYSVFVTNTCGSASAQIFITESLCNETFPNAFTPNKDGKNDFFKILNAFNLKEYNFSIYNRYGQKVFQTSDYNKGWDGTLNGNPQDTGTYVYYCSYIKNGKKIETKGTLVLLR